MSAGFAKYLAGLKVLLESRGVMVTEKPLDYGKQLVLTGKGERTVLSLYDGKKGIKAVWSLKETSWIRHCREILEGPSLMTAAQPGQSKKQSPVNGTNGAVKNRGMMPPSGPRFLFDQEPNFPGLWAGSDESGKGDYFGPLVVAAVCLDREQGQRLLSLGVRDCKELSDAKVLTLASQIESYIPDRAVLIMKPAGYNRRYDEIFQQGHKLNYLLASGHFQALSQVLKKRPDCHWVLIDQFQKDMSLLSRLQEAYPHLKKIKQQPRAEQDIAVAAASVLARASFIKTLQQLAAQIGVPELPKGCGPRVKDMASKILQQQGKDVLEKLVKKHFVTSKKLGL